MPTNLWHKVDDLIDYTAYYDGVKDDVGTCALTNDDGRKEESSIAYKSVHKNARDASRRNSTAIITHQAIEKPCQ
jgi:hypothetical protein